MCIMSGGFEPVALLAGGRRLDSENDFRNKDKKDDSIYLSNYTSRIPKTTAMKKKTYV